MNRQDFLKEVARLQMQYGCKLAIEIHEAVNIDNGKQTIEEIMVSWVETDMGEHVTASEVYDTYTEVASALDEKVSERTRHIFDKALYESIAQHMIDSNCNTFDKRIGRYNVYVEWDSRFGEYSEGCADIEDGWREVDTNFDSDALEAAIDRMKDARDEADETRRYTEYLLRKTA